MNLIIALIVGVVGGWIASVLMGTGREALVRNLIVGVIGAYVGGWIVGALADSANAGTFSVGTTLASALGAVALLLLVRRFDRA